MRKDPFTFSKVTIRFHYKGGLATKYWRWIIFAVSALAFISESHAQFGTVPTAPRDQRKLTDNAEFREGLPGLGEPLPDLAGYDEQGNEFSLDQLKGHLTVLVFGCLT